jgi:hypothetical protein
LLADLYQAGELEATADSPEFTNLARQFLLAFDPGTVGGRCEFRNAGLSQRRRGVSAQELAESFELEDAY